MRKRQEKRKKPPLNTFFMVEQYKRRFWFLDIPAKVPVKK